MRRIRAAATACAALAALALCAARARASAAAFAPPQPASPAAAPLVVLATVDGGVVALDAATGAQVFALPPTPSAPAVSSWAAPGEPRYIPTLNGQVYRLPPDGSDDLSPPEEVDAVFLSPDASAAGFSDGAGSSALAQRVAGRTTVPSAVLRHTHTSVTYIDAVTGKVVRELDFESPQSFQSPRTGESGLFETSVPTGPVILLSRTKVGVRVVDAVSGAELANASITHTTPSLLSGNLCVPAAEMDDMFSGDEDDEPSGFAVGSAPMFKTIVDAQRGVVKMIATGSSDVRWTANLETDILSAHGLGSVRVVQIVEEPAIDGVETEESDGSCSGDESGGHGVEEFDNKSCHHRVAGGVLVRGDGSSKYAITAGNRGGVESQRSQEAEKLRRESLSPALPRPSSSDLKSDSNVVPVRTSIRWTDRFLRILRREDSLAYSTWDDVQIDTNGNQVTSGNSDYGREHSKGLSAGDVQQNILELMGLCVALGVILGVTGLGIARRVRSHRLRESSESSTGKMVASSRGDGSVGRSEELEASNGSSASASAVPVRSGSGWMTIGCFEVSSKVLGTGSHGTVVYEGRMMPGARRIAVKRLLRQFYESARQEIALLVELDEASPHVVRYFAMEEDAEFIYLALELCNGSLAERVAGHAVPAPPKSYTRGPLPRVTCKALRQLMQGLVDLHRLGMVHRDLKPHNVLCQNVNLKLADVGLALRLDAGRSSYSVAANAAGGVGTTGWRAPEVLNGQRQTRAVDVFSLGCIISYVVTGGDHPFGSEIFGRDGRIVSGKADLRSLAALQAPEVVDVVERMLAKKPSDRPTANEALLHPFFWTDAMKLSFLVDISDRLYDLRHDVVRYTELLDESSIAVRHCSDWPSRLEPEVMREIGPGYISSASNLLRAMRNKKNHYSELSPRLHKILGPIPEDDDSNTGTSNVDLGNLLDEQNFLTYFLKRVPQLLMCVYAHARNYPELVRQPHFSRYGFKVAREAGSNSFSRFTSQQRDGSADSSRGTSSEANLSLSTNPRYYYARGKIVASSEACVAPEQLVMSNLQESGVYCPGAGERWRFRLTTGLYDIPEEGPGDLTEEDTHSFYTDVTVSPSPGTPSMTLGAPPGFEDTGFSLYSSQASTARFEPPPRPMGPPGFDSRYELPPRSSAPPGFDQPLRPRGFGSDVTRQGPVSQTWYGSSRPPQGPSRPRGTSPAQNGRLGDSTQSSGQYPGLHPPQQRGSWPERKPALGYSEPGAGDNRDWSGLRRGS